MRKKACIVTPDIIGPIKNGGIGTHCYWLARFLVELELDVTVLFTSACECNDFKYYIEDFKQKGITFISLLDMPESSVFEREACWFYSRYMKVYNYLRNQSYDIVHFQEWQANGFTSIRAKRLGIDFHHAILTVTMHSPAEWVREGMLLWPQNPILEAQLDYAERYCCEYADILISPTKYLLTWARDNGWKLAQKQLVIQNVYKSPLRTSKSINRIDYSHLVFFGRLETRKGLELFCNAISMLLLSPTYDKSIKKITFLGKPDRVKGGVSSLDYLTSIFLEWGDGLNVEIISTYDSFEALNFLKSTGAIAVIPSLSDNHPYTVVECIENNIPFVASLVGGIPELVNEKSLFKPRARDLSLAIENRVNIVSSIEPLYNLQKAQNGWHEIHVKPEEDEFSDVIFVDSDKYLPKVSICVAYYNHGVYLPQLLESIERITYKNYEVIVVNDGSTCSYAKQVFSSMRDIYAAPMWRFYEKENEGLGATRNYGAKKATGRYLIFMDSDNIATSNMITDFVDAIEYSKVDCLTCFFMAFKGNDAPENDFVPPYTYAPLGPCLEVASLINVFGDSNFCIRKDVFDNLGGFTTDPTTGYEDWEFLANLTRTGYSQDVLPLPLFFYRHSETSMLRTTSSVANKRRVLESICKDQELFIRRLIFSIEVPLGEIFLRLERDGELSNLYGTASSIIRLEKENRERNEHIQGLNQFIEVQGTVIRKLQQENQERNQHIERQDLFIQEQGEHVRRLERENQERNQHIERQDLFIQEQGEHVRRLERENQERNQHIKMQDIHIDELSAHIRGSQST